MKKFYRILVLVLSLAMIFSAFAVTASAAATDLTVNVDLTKRVYVNSWRDNEGNFHYAALPNTTFEFSLVPGVAEAAKGVYAGVALDENTVTVEVKNDTQLAVVEGNTVEYAEFETSISAKGTFPTPGIYHYVLSETKGDIGHVTYADAVYDIYVYVGFAENSENLEIISIVSYNAKDEKEEPQFKNEVKDTQIGGSKTVTGNMGDKEKPFTFILKTTPDKLYAAGVEFYIEKFAADGSSTVDTVVVGTDYEFTMAHNESFKTYLVPAGLNWTIEEADYSDIGNGEGGYTTTVNGKAGNTLSAVTGDNTQAAFVNDKTITTTGVFMSYGPYIAVIVVAVLAIALFALSKKRKASEI